jgi:hypothetical protein
LSIPPGLQGGGVEGVDLCSAFGSEGGMLFDGMRMKAVDPEYRMVQAVTDTVGTRIFGDLCDPSHTECTQRSIVKARGLTNVGNSDSGVIDHGVSPRLLWVPSAALRWSGF